MKVLISDKMDSRCVEILEKTPGVEVDLKTDLSAAQLEAIIGDYAALIVRSSTQVTESVLRAGRQLKVVGRAGIGVDNIDVDAATRGGIIVMNTPGGNSVSAAEFSFAMLMSMARNIPQASAALKAGRWERSKFTGVELTGKTLGVVGLGKVGREVALRAAACKMRVLGYDLIMLSEEVALSCGAQMSSLEEIYAHADFISVHIPLTPQTRHMLSDEQFARCKKGVYLINCARGGIIDEEALVRALDAEQVAGAAFDVFEEEPPTSDVLTGHDKVICTPHLGASTTEAQASVALQIAEQVGDVLQDRVIRNAVNVPSVEPDVYQKIRPFLKLAENMGRILVQLGEGQLERITVEYHGDVTVYPTAPLTAAVLKGIMEAFSEEVVNFVNAPFFAQERGIHVDELRSSDHADFASLITVIYQTSQGKRVLGGTLFGKSEARLVRLDEYHFDAVPERHMLFYVNNDIPGIIGRIGTLMGTHKVNIGQMSCGRHKMGGRALSILNVDSEITDAVLEEVAAQDNITWVKKVNL
jgi:D-3-phosphoglycerate dehydrogenase